MVAGAVGGAEGSPLVFADLAGVEQGGEVAGSHEGRSSFGPSSFFLWGGSGEGGPGAVGLPAAVVRPLDLFERVYQ